MDYFPFNSIFLRDRSLSNARLILDLKKKTCKIQNKNVYLTENLLGRNGLWLLVGNHNYMYYICAICAKEFSDSNFFFKLSSY